MKKHVQDTYVILKCVRNKKSLKNQYRILISFKSIFNNNCILDKGFAFRTQDALFRRKASKRSSETDKSQGNRYSSVVTGWLICYQAMWPVAQM